VRNELELPARQRVKPVASHAHVGTDHLDQVLLTAWSNAIAERWIGGCRRELLDRTLTWNQAHLRRILREYEIHHNQHRNLSATQRF
jgi:hypothetical protein